MKSRFTAEEWELLKLLPIKVFLMVASADGKIDEKEIAQFDENLRKAPYLLDPLHKELFVDLCTSDFSALINQATDQAKFTDRLVKIKACLQEVLTPEEYERFVGSMFIGGCQIANASGGGFLGRGSKVSQEEQTALTNFANAFGLTPASLAKHFPQK